MSRRRATERLWLVRPVCIGALEPQATADLSEIIFTCDDPERIMVRMHALTVDLPYEIIRGRPPSC